MAETFAGDEVYQHRYMLRFKHLFFVIIFTLIVPITLAILVLDSYGDNIDDDFKEQVVLQKIWMGNDCEINLDDASEIL